jgi:hypothetical protein
MMPRDLIKNLGGAAKVDDLIGLASSNHGTDTPLAAGSDERMCAACRQQVSARRPPRAATTGAFASDPPYLRSRTLVSKG